MFRYSRRERRPLSLRSQEQDPRPTDPGAPGNADQKITSGLATIRTEHESGVNETSTLSGDGKTRVPAIGQQQCDGCLLTVGDFRSFYR